MQNYQIKSELNILVNSTNKDDTPFTCRKKLDFVDKKTTIVQGYDQMKTRMAKAPSNSKRNARERRRVRTINDYFSQLQKFLPHTKQVSNGSVTTTKKMSKVETLKAAIDYIEYLVKFAPANSQQLFQITKSSSNSSSLLSSPASSVSSTTTQLTDKFKSTLSKSTVSPSKFSPSSPSTLQNTSTCSTPKSNNDYSQVQYQNSYPQNYQYNYTECNYYNQNYYYNQTSYPYGDGYENSNSFNAYYPIDSTNAQMSPVNNTKSTISSSSSSLSSSNGSNYYQYQNEIKSEYYLNECETNGLNL